jgi:hypothetical protein
VEYGRPILSLDFVMADILGEDLLCKVVLGTYMVGGLNCRSTASLYNCTSGDVVQKAQVFMRVLQMRRVSGGESRIASPKP